MTREEFDARKQKINRQAAEYAGRGRDLRLREQIWLSLWEIHPVLFAAQSIRDFRRFPPSSLYETGVEFLTEVFSESIPQVLDSYAEKNADVPDPSPFLPFFEICFARKVYDAYSNILDHMPHESLFVREPAVQVYQEPREDSLIPGVSLRQGMARRILGRVFDGKQTWLKTQLKTHGRTVYVQEEDVECRDKFSQVDLDDIAEPEASGQPDDRIMLSDLYDDYILSLLSLAGQLYARTQARDRQGLTRKYGFRLLYTEKLLDKLKQIYDATGDVRTAHEQEALSVAEIDLLDYLLTDICRTFSAIAATPLCARRDFAYLNTDSAEKIRIPVDYIIYAHFLTDIKGIDRKPDSIPPSMSKFRTEFNEQYALFCETDVGCR